MAYRCFCSAERFDKLAQGQNKLKLRHVCDGLCANLTKSHSRKRDLEGEKHVVRLKMPKKCPVFQDIIYGVVGSASNDKKTHSASTEHDNMILLKSDGLPTYHLANVVDDHHMGITHVIRGIVSFLV